MIPTIYKYDNTDDFIAEALDAIESLILAKLEDQEIIRIALSGGESPKKVYYHLGKSDEIEWNRIEFYLVDERCVPIHDPRSNLGMIENQLLRNTPGIRAVHAFDTTLPIEEAVKDYAKNFEERKEPFFDLTILGIGEDGHTASIFPHSAAVHEESQWVLHTQTDENKVKDRLTLTFPAILSSDKIFFLVRGEKKEPMLQRLLKESTSPEEMPAAKVFQAHPHTEIFFDPS